MTLVAKEKQTYLNRPKATGITVRKPQFNPKAIRRHYFANSPVMSHLLTALSSTFPIGEQFFVHSVRNVRDKVSDEKLQAEISAFIGQEAMHSKAHTDFNDAWRTDDYNLNRFQAWLARRDQYVRTLHPKIQLAITCAFEHFTALLGGYVLRHPEVLSSLDDDAIKLWVWHAIEEIEHRSVAFDVYQHVYGDDKTRRMIMRSVTTGFASLTFYSASRLFLQDKKKSIPKVAGNIFGFYLIGKMLIEMFPEYLSYYKKGFHPSEIDYTAVVKYWKERMAKQYFVESFQQETTPILLS